MSAKFCFDGKKVLVTGAGKGIGRIIAKRLSECGADVLALSRTQADLDSLKAEVPGIQCVCVDLADWAATRAAVEALGPVDLLVNNASVLIPQKFLDITKEALESTLAINVSAMVNVSQVVAKGMVERGAGGSIVIISSFVSQLAIPHAAALSASKGAEISLMKTMATELGPHKIRVNAIQPTAVLTPSGRRYWETNPAREPFLARHPLGKFAEMEDIADGTMFLLSEQSAMITGACLPIDGGLMSN